MKKIIFVPLLVCTLSSGPAHSFEPTTMLALNAVIGFSNLFQKKGPDVKLQILQSQRELMKELHSRLDTVENGIILTLKKIDEIPDVVFDQALKAQEYELGKRISAFGLNYAKSSVSLEEDRLLFGKNSDRFNYIKFRYEENLNNNINDLSIIIEDFYQRENFKSTGAVTAVVTSLIDISMRLELERLYRGSPSELTNAAEQHLEKLKIILDSEHEGSLAKYASTLRLQIIEEMKNSGWLSESGANPELPFDDSLENIAWTFGGQCVSEENPVRITDLKQVRRTVTPQFNPPFKTEEEVVNFFRSFRTHKFYDGYPFNSFVKVVPTKSKRLFLKLNETSRINDEPLFQYQLIWEDWVDVIEGCSVVSASPKREQLWQDLARIEGTYSDVYTLKWNTDRTENDFLADHNKYASNLVEKINTFSRIKGTLNLVEKTSLQIQAFLNGDIQALSISDFEELINPSADDILFLLRSAERQEAIQDTIVYEREIRKKQRDIEQLIQSQEDELQEAFRSAAKAAKTNKYLSYLKAGAMAVKLYTELPTDADEKIKAIGFDAIQKAKIAIETEGARDPASANLLSKLNDIADIFKFWGGLNNAKKQFALMDSEREKIQNLLPHGTTRKYDVYIIGSDFYGFFETDKPKLLKRGAKYHSTVTLEGKRIE